MSNTTIYIKTDLDTKGKAQKTTREPRSGRTKAAVFDEFEEIPNKKTQAILKQSQEDYKNGKTSPAFRTGKETLAWLEKQGI